MVDGVRARSGTRALAMGRRAQLLRLAVAALIGVAAGLLCAFVIDRALGRAGDLGWALRAAGDLLAGRDVYMHPYAEDVVPYPLPAAFFALPFVGLPAPLAGGLFFGLSTMLLAWCLLGEGDYWWLLLFLSWPFCYSLLFVQWSPLIVAMAFVSPLLPLLLVKPQVALPMLVLHPFRWQGLLLLGLTGLASLLVYPTWPVVWLSQIGGYKGAVPPLFSMPFGPLLLLALLRYRDRGAWFFLLLAAMPQRVVYDQLALLLLARTRQDLVWMVVCSWITMPALLVFDGWLEFPLGWQSWIIGSLYLPALVVLLRGERPSAAAGAGPSL